MSMVETEVKFYIKEVPPMRKRILALGAVSQGRHFETNLCFDNETNDFKKRGTLLRLRKDTKARLTFKAPSRDEDPGFKTYQEIEIEVESFDRCQAILEALGFHPAQAYEKWRETFLLRETHILMDTTPYGVFIEIEGEKPEIRTIAGQLGMAWKERILLNYLAMFEMIRRGERFPFKDMTFANFRSVDCPIEAYVSAMFAG
jgi:adenylate cyclase class 2